MKALRFDERGLHVTDVPVPQPSAGEALVRVTTTGICNTDLEIVRGYAGFSGTIGHEFVGIVESAPTDSALVGCRVIGEINAGCGFCERCRKGDPRHCETRTVLGIHARDGAHAEFFTLPTVNLLPVPDTVPDELAVFAEPLAAAYGITEQVAIGPETKVAVIGDGKLGILCALALALESRHVVLVGKHESKLALAARRGIDTVLLSDVPALGRSFDVVVEASGAESGFATALNLLRPRGTMVLKSTFQGSANPEMWRVVVDEITIVGSRCGRFAPVLAMMDDGRIDVRDLITDEFPLSDGVAAMNRASEKGVLKILLRMN